MTKILHTSDWHLGRTTWGQSRAPDHEAVLAQIIDIATRECPDLILNTGDLFDQQRPPVQAMRLATDVLHELSTIAPVVVICGNHDSPPLLHWLHGLMGHHDRISLVADPDAVRDGVVLRYRVTHGRLHLAALPFITANRIVNVLDNPAGRRKTYAEFIALLQQRLLRELNSDFDADRDVSVFAAHQYVSGSIPSRTENLTHTSDFYTTDPDHIPPVDYAAYGHIHRPQSLPGSRVIGAYAGSPIQLDLGEVGEDKSVVLAHLHPGEPTDIKRIPLSAGRRLQRLTGTLEELSELAETVTDEICHITVKTATHQPDLSCHVRALFPNATIVHIHEDCADRKLDLVTAPESDEGEPDNLAMFSTYLAQRTTTHAPASDILYLFGTLLSHTDDEAPPTLPAEELLAADLATFAVPTDPEEALAP
jgi:exonuclease SbcD